MCRNNMCDCGSNYVQVAAVVRTPPSSVQLQDMSPSNILGYYCFSTGLLPRMTGNFNIFSANFLIFCQNLAAVGEDCSIPLPLEPFNASHTYCAEELVCIHCAESGALSRGKCANMTELLAADNSTLIPETTPEPTPEPTTRPLSQSSPAPQGRNAGFSVEPTPLFYQLVVVSLIAIFGSSLVPALDDSKRTK